MSTKSLVTRVLVDQAKQAHNCQANARHRLQRGDFRLKVRNGRSWGHYCSECAKKILARDIAWLQVVDTHIKEKKLLSKRL